MLQAHEAVALCKALPCWVHNNFQSKLIMEKTRESLAAGLMPNKNINKSMAHPEKNYSFYAYESVCCLVKNLTNDLRDRVCSTETVNTMS